MPAKRGNKYFMSLANRKSCERILDSKGQENNLSFAYSLIGIPTTIRNLIIMTRNYCT